MTNSADPDLFQKPTDLDLHCLLRQCMSCSAREGLTVENRFNDTRHVVMLLNEFVMDSSTVYQVLRCLHEHHICCMACTMYRT